MNSRILKIGLLGLIVSATCCFTPILYSLLGIIGLTTLASCLDGILFPAFAVFLAITGYALWQHKQAK